MTEFYTARVNYVRNDSINITVKDNPNHVLSPTWRLVDGHKAGRISDQEYTEQYLDLLRKQYSTRSSEFLALFNRQVVTLTCYCKHDCFCHRHLAIGILQKLAKSKGLDFWYRGERYGVSGEYTYANYSSVRYEF